MRNLDFIGVGAARSGTTWVSKMLSEHPNIYIPRRKELHYFNNDNDYQQNLKNYRPSFDMAPPNSIMGEYTPRYMINAIAMERIAQHFPTAKIIMMLRNPILRSYSQYRYFRNIKLRDTCPSFPHALEEKTFYEDYIAKSLYSSGVERVYELFDKDQVFVGDYNDVTADPEVFVRALYRFLNVDPSFIPPSLHHVINSANAYNVCVPSLFAKAINASCQKGAAARAVAWAVRKPPFINLWRQIFTHQPEKLTREVFLSLYTLYFEEDARRTSKLTGVSFDAQWRKELAE